MAFTDDYRSMFVCRSWDMTPNAQKYLCGLVQTEHRKGNMERMEEIVPGVDYQSMQQFISNSPWCARKVMNRVARDAGEMLGGDGNLALVLDESYFQKSGMRSVGVARQWNGRLGKTENSQVAVFAALANGERSTLVDAEFYLPKEWTDDSARMLKARVPEERHEYKTKLDLAWDIICRQRQLGVPFDYVCADGLYGQSQAFCRLLDDAGEAFVLHVHCDQRIYLDDPMPYLPPKKPGRGLEPKRLVTDVQAHRVDHYLSALTEGDWEVLNVRDTTRGPLMIKSFRREVWLWDKEEEQARKWTLFVRKELDGSDIKYCLANCPPEMPTISIARREAQRFWVERSFEDGKKEVSMGDYQTTGWLAWHHHMALVMMAMLFATRTRMRYQSIVPLLSYYDICEMLAHFLPKRKASKAEVIRQMQTRHRMRQRDIESKTARRLAQLRQQGFIIPNYETREPLNPK